MIVMTLNVTVLASTSKNLVVCRLVAEQSIDVLFLQETMGEGVVLTAEFGAMPKVGGLYPWMKKGNPEVFCWDEGFPNFRFYRCGLWAFACVLLCILLN